MKKRIKGLLALVMSLTMVFGMSTTAFAATYTTDTEYGTREFCDGHWEMERYTFVYIGNNRYLYFTGREFEDVYRPGDDGIFVVDSKYYKVPNAPVVNQVYKATKDSSSEYYNLMPVDCGCRFIPKSPSNNPSNTPAHEHSFIWQTITEPTKDADGLEGEVCSCGAIRNTQPISVFGYLLNDYAPSLINAAKPGQTITFEFGEYNSFPKSFMAKLVDKSAQNVTFVFHYKWNHVKQEITIPAGTPIDLNFDWYGPAKMAELYGANKQ